MGAFYNVDMEGPEDGDGIHNHVNTRLELQAYEPALADLIGTMFDANQTFKCPTESCNCSTFKCPVFGNPPAWRCDSKVDLLDSECGASSFTTASCCADPLPPACLATGAAPSAKTTPNATMDKTTTTKTVSGMTTSGPTVVSVTVSGTSRYFSFPRVLFALLLIHQLAH